MHFDRIRRLSLAALLAAAVLPAVAQPASAPVASASAPARTWAIVSLIGDDFSVVSRRPEVATNLNPNERTVLKVPDAVFDRIATDAIEAEILKANPGTPVLRALIRDPRLFALQEQLWTESPESHDMRIALHDLLAKSGATDLLLVTKRRWPLSFPLATGRLSAPGVVSGLGFYIDTQSHIYNTGDKKGGEGFLGPYASISITHLTIDGMRLVKTGNGFESTLALPAEKADASVHPWDALTPREKVDWLDRVIRAAVTTAMPGQTGE